MRKISKIVLCFLFIILTLEILFWLKKATYSIDTSSYEFTREELQNMVVSTALKYFYNTEYSDYEQYAMDIL